MSLTHRICVFLVKVTYIGFLIFLVTLLLRNPGLFILFFLIISSRLSEVESIVVKKKCLFYFLRYKFLPSRSSLFPNQYRATPKLLKVITQQTFYSCFCDFFSLIFNLKCKRKMNTIDLCI